MNNADYLSKLNVLPSECSCDKCKRMCHAPCCMSVEDAEKLLNAGYASRLMFDDLPSNPDTADFLKPALKGYEGEHSPWETSSLRGCTFWNEDGKCELHDKGLKPIQGRIAIHDNTNYDMNQLAGVLNERWKKLVSYQEDV